MQLTLSDFKETVLKYFSIGIKSIEIILIILKKWLPTI